MTLNQLFDLSLYQRRDEIALEWQGRGFTFGEMGARARRMANALRARGSRQGDRLCVQLANCVELIDLYLACVRLGVIFVPVNVLYREREVAHILTDATPAAFRHPGQPRPTRLRSRAASLLRR
jgi:acyl-CoA synthetase (AMP-forming)/AMP-acid ligase II